MHGTNTLEKSNILGKALRIKTQFLDTYLCEQFLIIDKDTIQSTSNFWFVSLSIQSDQVAVKGIKAQFLQFRIIISETTDKFESMNQDLRTDDFNLCFRIDKTFRLDSIHCNKISK